MHQSSSNRIPLPDKIKKVPLPPFHVWSRAMNASPSSIFDTFAEVEVVDSSRLFFGWNRVGYVYCVIGSQGYIVVYKDEEDLTGYAFNLTYAKSMYVKEKVDSSGRTVKMKIVFKWKFGKLILRLGDNAKNVERVLRAAFMKPEVNGDFHENARQEMMSDPDDSALDDDYANAPCEESEGNKESVCTDVAIPYAFSTPFVPVQQDGAGDARKVSFSLSDGQIGALHSFNSSSPSRLSL